VGRDIRDLKEIDQRKIGRVLETDELNDELQTLLNKKVKNLDDYTVTFELEAVIPSTLKSAPEPEPKITPEPEPKITPKPVPKPISRPEPIKKVAQPTMIPASEYDTKIEIPKISEPIEKPTIKSTPVSIPKQASAPKSTLDIAVQAKIGFVIIGVLDHYDDIWISKKEGGGYSVEHMDGKVCEFSISNGKIKFTLDSFSGISTNIKTEIQQKFVELSKLI